MGKKDGATPPGRPPKVAHKAARKEAAMNKMSWSSIILCSVVLAVIAYSVTLFLTSTYPPQKMPPIKGITRNHKLWGTHRSHLYFGLRANDPKSPLFGIMWYEQPEVTQMPKMRHWCDQGDGLERYAWYAADGRSFGRHNLTDSGANFKFDWVNHEDTWTARISIMAPKSKRYSLVFYLVGQENDEMTYFTVGEHLHDGILSGNTKLFGEVSMSISSKQEYKIPHSTLMWDDHFQLNMLNEVILMNTRAMHREDGKLIYQLSQQKPLHRGRFAAVQLNVGHKVDVEVSLSTRINKPPVGKKFIDELERREAVHSAKMQKTFALADSLKSDPIYQQMANVALSNMLGAIGYWYGYNKVQVGKEIVRYGPHELVSAVPSRPFFPRGFLWDEGFHNMLIRKFDPELSLEIIVSWLNTMSTEGWIPREMILDEEALAKVPAEFEKQRPDVANPPSLFYVIDEMIADKEFVDRHADVLKQVYPKLSKWYNWLLTSQAGKVKGTFRWRGRNSTIDTELNPKTLPSGLDDYPRASHPNVDEYHLDLRCWMSLCSSVMQRLAALYGTDAERSRFDRESKQFADVDDLVKRHWSEQHKGFFDYGKHSFKVSLRQEPRPEPGNPHAFVVKRYVAREPQMTLVTDVFGYNSLFPLMLKMLPADSIHLTETLKRLNSTADMWTPYGLRSVGQSSPYYEKHNTEHDPPYWRGYIWINANYMALSGLRHYSMVEGPNKQLALELFVSLRNNLVDNMAKEFSRTGYLWEHYDDRTGQGRGTQPFNGWSSLVLLAMGDEMHA